MKERLSMMTLTQYVIQPVIALGADGPCRSAEDTSQPACLNLAIASYNPTRLGRRRRVALGFIVRSAAAVAAHPAYDEQTE